MGEATIIVILTTSFVVGLSGALMPGPLLALTVGETARHGFWSGPLLVLGHAILELSLVIALVFGLSKVVGNGLVFSIVGIVGGLVLIYMGYSTIRQGWRSTGIPTSKAKTANRMMVVSGIVVSASNPYWLIWWATIGTTYLLWSLKVGAVGVASFFTGHIFADLIWYTFISFIIVKGKKLISNNIYKWFLIVCGLALLGLGGYFIFSGIKFLVQ